MVGDICSTVRKKQFQILRAARVTPPAASSSSAEKALNNVGGIPPNALFPPSSAHRRLADANLL